jgi:four helix bundle suffix protein
VKQGVRERNKLTNDNSLIPPHGGYRKLKSFQLAQLVYDITVYFCNLHIDRRSRTHDQMVQAARSGVQNIAEGSVASGTSKKTEIKLTNVARASLEELRLDFEDFLRQRGMCLWSPDHPALQRFKARRCATMNEFLDWQKNECGRTRTHTDDQGQKNKSRSGSLSMLVGAGPCLSVLEAELAANGALSLLNLCCYFLDRQIASQAEAFEKQGGFTERLYRVRTAKRGK